jgi:hypothetical protein
VTITLLFRSEHSGTIQCERIRRVTRCPFGTGRFDWCPSEELTACQLGTECSSWNVPTGNAPHGYISHQLGVDSNDADDADRLWWTPSIVPWRYDVVAVPCSNTLARGAVLDVVELLQVYSNGETTRKLGDPTMETRCPNPLCRINVCVK